MGPHKVTESKIAERSGLQEDQLGALQVSSPGLRSELTANQSHKLSGIDRIQLYAGLTVIAKAVGHDSSSMGYQWKLIADRIASCGARFDFSKACEVGQRALCRSVVSAVPGVSPG